MDERKAAPGGYPVDELAEVRRLLAEPPPAPDVVAAARVKLERVTLNRTPAARGAGEGWRPPWSPGAARPAPRRWPGWLAPVAAAAAVAAVVTASVTVSALVQRGPSGAAAAGAASISRVPPFFVSIPGSQRGPAVIAATATGAVLGRVAPPRQDPAFMLVTAAADSRTFIFAAAPGGTSDGPDRFYKLVLDRSGHPGRLTPLPIPAEPGLITGLAVSPDGSKLAVSVLGPNGQTPGAKLTVFSVATGTEHAWVWPGHGWTGWTLPLGSNEYMTRTLSWAADNRRLLFEQHTGHGASESAQARILDTAVGGSDLRAASTLVPIPEAEIFHWGKTPAPPFFMDGPMMLTSDGTKIVAPTVRDLPHHSKAGKSQPMLEVWITEFSVGTGKPVRVLARQQVSYDNNDSVLWVDATGTAMVASHPRPEPNPKSLDNDSVIGVQAPAAFTPLPPGVQRYFQTGQPAW